jgi:hypothetical protein
MHELGDTAVDADTECTRDNTDHSQSLPPKPPLEPWLAMDKHDLVEEEELPLAGESCCAPRYDAPLTRTRTRVDHDFGESPRCPLLKGRATAQVKAAQRFVRRAGKYRRR